MEFNFAFLANSAEVIDGRFFVIGGGIDGLTLPGVPAYVPALAVIASVHFDPDECGHDYQFRTTITLPDGNDMGVQASAQLQARIVPQAPDLGANLKVSIGLFGLLLPLVGRYRINFFVGEQPIGDLYFNVVTDQPVAEPGEQR